MKVHLTFKSFKLMNSPENNTIIFNADIILSGELLVSLLKNIHEETVENERIPLTTKLLGTFYATLDWKNFTPLKMSIGDFQWEMESIVNLYRKPDAQKPFLTGTIISTGDCVLSVVNNQLQCHNRLNKLSWSKIQFLALGNNFPAVRFLANLISSSLKAKVEREINHFVELQINQLMRSENQWFEWLDGEINSFSTQANLYTQRIDIEFGDEENDSVGISTVVHFGVEAPEYRGVMWSTTQDSLGLVSHFKIVAPWSIIPLVIPAVDTKMPLFNKKLVLEKIYGKENLLFIQLKISTTSSSRLFIEIPISKEQKLEADLLQISIKNPGFSFSDAVFLLGKNKITKLLRSQLEKTLIFLTYQSAGKVVGRTLSMGSMEAAFTIKGEPSLIATEKNLEIKSQLAVCLKSGSLGLLSLPMPGNG